MSNGQPGHVRQRIYDETLGRMKNVIITVNNPGATS